MYKISHKLSYIFLYVKNYFDHTQVTLCVVGYIGGGELEIMNRDLEQNTYFDTFPILSREAE